MQKYLSCPLCGTPEPELLKHDRSQADVEVWLIQCLDCHKIVKIEDVTDADEDER